MYTNNLEEELAVGTKYKDTIKGFELRRTEIACISFMGQVLCGAVRTLSATEPLDLPRASRHALLT